MHVFETPGDVLVRVSIEAGSVEVSAADVACVEVDVRPLRDNQASREAVEETRVELVDHGGRYEVVVAAPKRVLSFGFARGASIGVRITCPAGSRLETHTTSGDVRTTGRIGEIDASTASGDLDLGVVDGNLRGASASGDVSVEEVGGSGTIKSASGDIKVRLAHGALSVSSASGDVHVDRALASVSIANASGDIQVGAVEADKIRLQSVSGDVRVGVREGLRVWIDASSVSGTISSDLPAEDGSPVGENAAVEIHARTVRGDVGIVAAVGVSA